jgi:uncharacterized protein YegL
LNEFCGQKRRRRKEDKVKKHQLLLGSLVIISIVSVHLTSVSAQGPETQLAMLLDGSGSMLPSEFNSMLTGLAEAIENPNCVPQDGSVELTVIQFGSSTRTEVPPTVIDATNASSIAAAIRGITKTGGGTPMASAIALAIAEITGSPSFGTAARQVINLSTDGAPNSPSDTETARNDAIAAGIDEIDVEAVGYFPAVEWLRDRIVYPQPGTIHGPGYAGWPPPAPGWVRLVDDFDAYAATICGKFGVILQTPAVPEASTLILLGSAASGLAGYIALQLRARRRKQ